MRMTVVEVKVIRLAVPFANDQNECTELGALWKAIILGNFFWPPINVTYLESKQYLIGVFDYCLYRLAGGSWLSLANEPLRHFTAVYTAKTDDQF